MVSEKFRWGIVGFGWVARDYALPGLLAAGHRLVAVHDPAPAAEAAVRALAPGARRVSLDALLADPEVDAVYVATPNHRHRAPVLAALAAGKPVLCEKPMAATLADAEAIAAAAMRGGPVYGTAFDQRHHPAHATLRAEIAGGTIGTVTAVRLVYACWVDPCWARADGDNWRADPAQAGGGAVIDLAPHGLDLITYLLGEEPVELVGLVQRRVHAYDVEDGGMLLGRTRSGVLASLHVAYNTPEALPRRRLEVVGTGGQIVAENTMGQDPGGVLTHIDANGQARPLAFEAASPFTRQMAAFAHAARTGERAGWDAARDLRLTRLLARATGGA